MSLDITAYRRLTKAAPGEGMHPTFTDEADYTRGFVKLYENDDFPEHGEGIETGVVYHAAEAFGFRAGSYGGYNAWRDQLAHLAHGVSAATVWEEPDAYDAFDALINFSDCEGVIGPVVSAKLARDFAAFQAKADAHPDEWFRAKYADWRRAFEMAADGGAVDFH